MCRKIISFRLIAFLLCISVIMTFSSCSQPLSPANDSGKIKVVTTLFAQYDFTRRVAGELADVTLLLKPGVESHTYEPSPSDIVTIGNSDLFIYTGKYMENWAQGIISGLSGEKTTVLDVSEGISLINTADEHKDDENGHDDTHMHQMDPHIWTSPANAIIMVKNIAAALSKTDPVHADTYNANARDYISELQTLDNDFSEMINSSKRREIMFGGRFAMYYFAQHYGLECMSAYDSCSSEAEPVAKLVAKIIDKIKSENIGAVYYEEMSNHSVADRIAEDTGASALLLHSCHNVSIEELARGETYLSLMRRNLENLRKGLN